MSMKNSNDTIWDGTSDLPICSTALCYRACYESLGKLREVAGCGALLQRTRRWGCLSRSFTFQKKSCLWPPRESESRENWRHRAGTVSAGPATQHHAAEGWNVHREPCKGTLLKCFVRNGSCLRGVATGESKRHRNGKKSLLFNI